MKTPKNSDISGDKLGMRTAAMEAVDRMFLDRARSALAAAGCAALHFLARNPGASIIELAKRLGRRASAIGLIMAIYEEAAQQGVVRRTAADLLAREIREKFPDGWSSQGTVHPLVKIGSWEDDIRAYVHDPAICGYAKSIMRHLAIDHPPPEGWKPQPQNEPLIDDLFDRYWPVGQEDGQRT